jgi:hypothetical protein
VDHEIGGPYIRTRAIGVAVDRDGFEAFLVTGADDTEGDFATVGDETR